MKKKGKVNPRDVPKTKLISEKKEESNEKFSSTERKSDFSKKEINKVKSRNNIDNNDENSKYYSSHLQENSQDLLNEKDKSNRGRRQRKNHEEKFAEASYHNEYQPEYSQQQHRKMEENEESRYGEYYGQETEYRLSNFKEDFNDRPNSTSSNLKSSTSPQKNYKGNSNLKWKKNVESESFNGVQEKKIRRFRKEEDKDFNIEVSSTYDPLSQDSDNDGVIDRYDMNFSDSNVSYRDTRDDYKYLPSSDVQRKNWDGYSILGEKGKESFQKNTFKKLYQSQSQFKDKGEKVELKSLNGKFRRKYLSYKANEEDKKIIQDLNTNKKQNSKYFKGKVRNLEEKDMLMGKVSSGKFRQDSLSEGFKSESEKNKDKYNINKKNQEKIGTKKEIFKQEKNVIKNENLEVDELDLNHSGISNKNKGKKRQIKDAFDNTIKKSNFDPKKEYTRTKKEVQDSKNVSEENKVDTKNKTKFHSKKDNKSEKDKFYKKEDKISKLYEKKNKKEKELIKYKKKSKKAGLEKPITFASAMTANYLYSGKDDNAGVNAAYKLSRTTEVVGREISHFRRKKPLKTQRKIKSLEGKIYKKESKLLFQRNFEELKKTKAYQNSNKLNRFFMKKKFQRDFRKKHGEGLVNRVKKSFANIGKKTLEALKNKGYKQILIALCILGLFFMLFQGISNVGSLTSGLTSNVIATSYLSKEEVLMDINNEFTSYEYALQDEIDSIKENYPNYDEYHIKGDSVGHDLHELFSYLTARYGEIKSAEEIQKELKKLFNQMYEKKYTSKSITKYDSEGNPYTYRILTLTIKKKSIDEIAREEFANYETNMAHYLALLDSQGNMSGYFGSSYGNLGEIIDNPNFGNPGLAFDSETAKALFNEAEKHIGKRYVFGASGPSNFDCSGFVCWSFTKSGVKRMPRTTAWLIYKNYCNPISPSEAKPGDIIFFKGTYNSGTPISHVGIYAGNGMMLHAGDPIQYASINSRYWKNHFYSFGRPK